MEVKLNESSVIVLENGEEVRFGVIASLSISDAVQLVKDLSIQMESAEFDERCYEFFKIVNGDCDCKH